MKWLDRRVAAPGPYLALCLTEKQYLKAMKHCNIKNPPNWIRGNADATTHILQNENNESVCIVCLNQGKHKKAEILGLLVHEAVHVWQEYAFKIGETSPASEQMAYGIQAISQELIAAYMRGSKRAKRTYGAS
jgi:hypothetical protein